MRVNIVDRKTEVDLKSHVSSWLQFYDDDLRQQYQQFKVAQSNTYAFIPLHIACCFFFFFGGLNGLRLSFDWYNVFVGLCITFFVFILGNYLVAIYFKDLFFSEDSVYRKLVNISFTSTLESLWIIGNNFCLCLFMFSTGYNGECMVNKLSIVVRGCNYSGISGQLPMDMVMTLFFAPIIHAVILKGASFLSSITCIFMATLALYVTWFVYGLTFSGPVILLFSPMCMLVLYEFHRQGISVFLLSRSQSMLLEEIDRLSVETHAKELRSMIGNVAHDLKTPLSAFTSGLDLISTMLSEIQEKIDRKGEVVRGLQGIGESVVNMKNINSFMRMSINRCIDYTKASNGMVLVPRYETVNFRETLQLPLNCMKNLQDGKIKIELMPVPPEIATNVIIDPQWFQENVLCLLSNAVKYSAEGVVTLSVSIIAATPRGDRPSPFSENLIEKTESGAVGGTAGSRVLEAAAKDTGLMLRIDVEDNGIGISDATKPLLFTPFKQAQRMVGGTGLGLYALAKRMEAQGGKYGVENRANGQRGCIFWFTFPYRPDLYAERALQRVVTDDSPPDPSAPSGTPKSPPKLLKADIGTMPVLDLAGRLKKSVSVNSPSDSPRSNPEPLNILLVDDSISILKMTGKMLTRIGHSVTTAENGAVALKMMSNTIVSDSGSPLKPRFDVVLMDLQMPIMDGLEATSRLRALEKEVESSGENPGHLMIVGVSANSDHLTIDAAFEAGVDDFIPKPFNMKSFEEICRRLMWRKHTNSLDEGVKLKEA